MKKNKNPFDDLFGTEEVATSSDFGSLLDQSLNLKANLKPGASLRGEILSIGQEEIFISTGTPVDGVIPRRDLGSKEVKVGDFIEARVVRVSDDQILLRMQGASTSSEVDSLEDAFDMELPVEGVVVEVNKGGFKVKVNGISGFCPMSQMDSKPIKDPSTYVGKKLDFTITQLALPRQLVVSRRKILDLQRAETEGELLKEIQVGDFIDGTITRMETFGAFLEIKPGIEGLIHISELSWNRVRHPQDVVTVDQRVNAKILKIDVEDSRLKISLSLKQGKGQLDPWSTIAEDYPVGRVLEGTIEKREAFGFFVNIAPGLTGLLPISRFKDAVTKIENKKPNEKIIVQITELQPEQRRMTLGIPGESGDDIDWKSLVTEKSNMGTMADLFKGIKGKA